MRGSSHKSLRTIHEVFVCDQADVAAVVTFNGHVSTKDLATGQPVRPCLISVSRERQIFSSFVLAELDPVMCLRRLNALVSNHPYDLEAVRPVVDFEALLTPRGNGRKDHLGLDVLISLPKPPPQRRA
jgi:restriction system protein